VTANKRMAQVATAACLWRRPEASASIDFIVV
jgi:hypothetical protein